MANTILPRRSIPFEPSILVTSIRLPGITSFHGNYQGERFSVVRDATGFIYVAQP